MMLAYGIYFSALSIQRHRAFQTNAIDQKRMDALEVLDWLRAQPDIVPRPVHAWDFQETTQWMQLLHVVEEE